MSLIALALAVVGTVSSAPPTDPPRLGLVSFKRVVIPDEVPAHLCTALAEDRDGFLWIGTQGGLVRYDGYEFKTFRPSPGDPRSLGGSYVRTLLASRDGRLWVGSFSDGVSVYDPATESFERYRHDPRASSSLSHDRVEALAEDRDGTIWIATYAGLDRLYPATGAIEHIPLPESGPAAAPASGLGPALGDDRLRALLIDRSGRLWVGGRGGLIRITTDGGARRIETVSLGKVSRPFVSRLFEDSRGRIWIGTADAGAAVLETDGVARFLSPRPQQEGGLSHFYVYGIAPGAQGEMWLATFGGGVDIVDVDSLKVIDRLRHDPVAASTIGGDRVGGLLKDRAGLLWVGTWGQGLARHDPSSRAFGALRYSDKRTDALSHPAAVRALEMRDGSVWVGTNGNGVDVFDWSRGRIDGFRPNASDPGALADGAVTCLAQGAEGDIWVATLDGTLHRKRSGGRRFERLTAASGLPGGAIRALVFGPDGALWAGSSEGLARIDPSTSRVASYRHAPGDPGTLSGHEVEALAFDPSGILWVGTGSGLNAFDPLRGKAVRILHDDAREDSLSNNWVPDLMMARDGRLWVATQNGASILESWDGRVARFSRASREPVDSLIEDEQGFVWLGPRQRVDPRTLLARTFSPADGLDFRTFFIASRSRTRAGALLFGSAEGLAIVRPAMIAPLTYEPPVVATEARVEGLERKGATRLQDLRLSAKERSFRLSFAALDYAAPEQESYRYRLEGFDPDWKPTDASRRTLIYTNLPPGSYRLRVQAGNRAGRFSSHELSLAVTVTPAWHQTAGFRGLAAVVGLGFVFGVHRLRLRQLRARSVELERVVDERTRELKAAYARIEEASLTDPLTGLRNRRFLESSIQADLDLVIRSHADGGGPGADLIFLLVDLDHFKKVNDTHGHAAGDAVLQQASAVLTAQTRSSDYVVRWGGEEFLVVARFVSRADAPLLAEKIRSAMAALKFQIPSGLTLDLTCSIGFAAYPFSPSNPQGLRWEAVVEAADQGLYAAKREGRNRCVGISAEGESKDAPAAP